VRELSEPKAFVVDNGGSHESSVRQDSEKGNRLFIDEEG
jgi:hypothetical protein